MKARATKRWVGMLAMAVGVAVASGALAQTGGLHAAKAAGQVGERYDGYVGLVKGAPASAQPLVDEINAKRRAEYEALARKNGLKVAQVAGLAGKKLIERATSGQYVMPEEGRWVQR